MCGRKVTRGAGPAVERETMIQRRVGLDGGGIAPALVQLRSSN